METLDMEKTLKDTPIWLSNNYGVLFWDSDIKSWSVVSPLLEFYDENFTVYLETKSFRKAMTFFMKLNAETGQ